MAIRHVKKRDLAEFRNVVETIGCRRRIGLGICMHIEASHTTSTNDLHEFAFG